MPLFVAAAALALPAAASAARPATSGERAAILKASGVDLPARCVQVRVRGQWAGWSLTNRPGCQPGNGVDILRRRHGRWRRITAGSECVAPHGMPYRVAHDLMGACRAVFPSCCFEYKSHPHTLYLAQQVVLKHLRWHRTWGRPVARARRNYAYATYSRAGGRKGSQVVHHVRVRLSRLRFRHGLFEYTRLRVQGGRHLPIRHMLLP